MTSWTPDIDPATIPDEILRTERARRNGLKRRSFTAPLQGLHEEAGRNHTGLPRITVRAIRKDAVAG